MQEIHPWLGMLVIRRRCETSWCDLDLTFHLSVVTLTFKILSKPWDCEVYEVDISQALGHFLFLKCYFSSSLIVANVISISSGVPTSQMIFDKVESL